LTPIPRPYGAARVWISVSLILLAATVAWSSARSLTVGIPADPRSLSPLSSTAQAEKNVSNQIVERLVIFTPDGDGVLPVLATSWEMISDDTLQLTLRQGVSFTNGEPFDAEAAAYSVNNMIEATAYASFVSMLDRAEVAGPYLLNVIAGQPTGERLLLASLALGSFIYPPIYTESVGLLDGFGVAPVGTGPYVFEEWVRDDRIVLRANPDYWDGAPNIDRLTFRPISEANARVAALEAGDIDFMTDVPLDAWNRISANAALVGISAPGARAFRVLLSTKWEHALQSRLVRQAITHAIDVDAMIEHLFQGQAVRQQGQPTHENTFGFNPDRQNLPYDPERARELLAEAGYPNGFDATFKYTGANSEIGEFIAAELENVGIRINQVVLEPGEFLNQLSRLELRDMFYSGGLSPPDAHFPFTSYICDFRYSYWCQPEYDDLMNRAQFTIDEEERRSLYQQAIDILMDDFALVPLYMPNDLYAHKAGLTNWVPHMDQFLHFTYIDIE
jgi:peptide/nickel transport system substrate-binding protein